MATVTDEDLQDSRAYWDGELVPALADAFASHRERIEARVRTERDKAARAWRMWAFEEACVDGPVTYSNEALRANIAKRIAGLELHVRGWRTAAVNQETRGDQLCKLAADRLDRIAELEAQLGNAPGVVAAQAATCKDRDKRIAELAESLNAWREWAYEQCGSGHAIGGDDALRKGAAARLAAAKPVRKGWVAANVPQPEYPNPTPDDLASRRFGAVWDAIKGWDLSRGNEGETRKYAGATGNDVMHILNALGDVAAKPVLTAEERSSVESLASIFGNHSCVQVVLSSLDRLCPPPKALPTLEELAVSVIDALGTPMQRVHGLAEDARRKMRRCRHDRPQAR